MMRLLVLFTALFFTGAALAETVLISATQDNTLYEDETGSLSNGAGNYMFVGANGEGSKRRALIAFNDLSAIPNGAIISSVKLHLHASLGSSVATTINLARLTKDWGEGASHGLEGEEEGAPAAAGDATWIHNMFPGSLWDSPGGDFVEVPSASLAVQSAGYYVFGSSEGLVNDVQNWLDGSADNYGWMLLASDEDVNASMRFDTHKQQRYHPTYRPKLEVEFSATGSPFDFSGIWYDPAFDGEGYNVFETKFGWLIYFFGYSAESGFLWLTSDVVTLDQLVFGETFELPMFIGVPGTFDDPTPASELIPYGTLQVIFNTCYNGVFTLDGLDGIKVSNVVKLAGVEDTTCVDY